jgi:crotonobetainyl-CoA:carnitine CoA-transferase CaiB-like acyl-CoA transferase
MKPLSDVTVVDLTVNVPGPFCSMILADLGARVIKVEPPGGDPLRHNPGMWDSLNRGKESIILNLKEETDRKALARLMENADIVLEGWRPGVAKRLGADYQTLSACNRGLVYCSISGFGQDGPWRDRPGHDLNYLALSGFLGVQVLIEGRPWPPPVLLSDLSSGLYAAIMVLAALNGEHASGVGAYIDLSMTESVLSLLGIEIGRMMEQGSAEIAPNVTFIPHYGLFQCADGRWFSLGIVHEDHFWDRFCEAAGLNDLIGIKFSERVGGSDRLSQRLSDVFLTLSADEWEERLKEADVPGAAVINLDEIFDSPQFSSRRAFVDVGARRFVAQPARFSTGPVAPVGGPPGLGEHTSEILKSMDHILDGIRLSSGMGGESC